MKKTSWEQAGKWYNQTVGESGHYYHEKIIMPNVLRLMQLKGKENVLDLASGQGILARYLPKEVRYLGVEISPYLTEQAKKMDQNPNHRYWVGDITTEIKMMEGYDWVTVILALQNVKSPFKVIRNARNWLKDNGRLLLVLNHPAFRIPKHADWGVDESKTFQYRKVDKYMTPLEIPIESSPYDKKDNQTTYSYHYPLSAYSEMLYDNGMVIEKIEEWISDKKSTGPMAKIEDDSRREIPLFMTIVARKK